MTTRQKAVQEKVNKRNGERLKKYDHEKILKVLEASSQGIELRSRLYLRTDLSLPIVMEYSLRLIHMGLLEMLVKPENNTCPTCHRRMRPDKRVRITEKGNAYLHK